MEAFEAQNLLKVFIGVLRSDSGNYFVGRHVLINSGAASLCRMLLCLDCYFKHRTYLTSYLSGATSCPTAEVTALLGAYCGRLEGKLEALGLKDIEEFKRAQWVGSAGQASSWQIAGRR